MNANTFAHLFQISPETRALIAEGWRKPTLLERWSADQQLLRVINDIRASGEPGTISHVLHFGLAENASVRSPARGAIRALLALVPLHAIPELDEAARREWEYLNIGYGLRTGQGIPVKDVLAEFGLKTTDFPLTK